MLTKEDWENIREDTNKQLNPTSPHRFKTGETARRRWYYLKETHDVINQVKAHSGTVWDRKNCAVSAPDHMWETWIAANANVHRIRNRSFPLYALVDRLAADLHPDGRAVHNLHQPPQPSTRSNQHSSSSPFRPHDGVSDHFEELDDLSSSASTEEQGSREVHPSFATLARESRRGRQSAKAFKEACEAVKEMARCSSHSSSYFTQLALKRVVEYLNTRDDLSSMQKAALLRNCVENDGTRDSVVLASPILG